MQGFISGIGHHKRKRLYEKCASRPDSVMNEFMCLAKRFNAVFNDNFPKLCEWNKGKENFCLKAKLIEISQIHLSCNACMH